MIDAEMLLFTGQCPAKRVAVNGVSSNTQGYIVRDFSANSLDSKAPCILE